MFKIRQRCQFISNEFNNFYIERGIKRKVSTPSTPQQNGIANQHWIKVEFMNGKERLLDDKGNLIGSGKQTKGNLFYLDLGDCSCFITQVEER